MIILILILFLVWGFSSLFGIGKSNNEGDDKNLENIDNLEGDGLDYEDESNEKSSAGGGSGSGGGGGGGNGGAGGASASGATSSSSASNCIENQIPFSTTGFDVNSVCNSQNQNGFCIDKTVTCSILITNLDNGFGGVFKVEFKFFAEEDNSNILYSTLSEFNLEAGEQHNFLEFYNVQSEGQDGIANKELTCFYATVSIPKKQVCS